MKQSRQVWLSLKNTAQSPFDTSHVDGTVKWEFEPDYSMEEVPLLFDSSATIGSDGTIYVGSHENNFYAINPDGTQKWMIDLGEPRLIVGGLSDGYKRGIHSSAAISSDGTIYIRSFSNYLYAINPDGTQKWKFPIVVTADSWSSPIIGEDGTIYVGSGREDIGGDGGELFAINPDGTQKWYYQAQSDVFPTATIADDGTIYSGAGGDGEFFALNPNGSVKWKFETGRHTETTVAIGSDNTLYFGNWDNKFYALNPDGSKKWEYLTGGEGIVASPAIASDGTIYLNADDGYFYAFNPDGTVKWKYDTGDPAEVSSSPSIGVEGTIYFGIAWQPRKDNFIALNPDGTEKWTKLIGGIAASPTIGSDGTVYISTHDGLYAFGSASGNEETEPAQQEIQVSPSQDQDDDINFTLSNYSMYSRLKGKIILKVEDAGKAYYIHPQYQSMYYLGRPADAFKVMREQGVGISEKDFSSFGSYAPSRLSGSILLRVEANGEAYYVNPGDLKMHYLGRPADAFNVMRELGLGINNSDFNNL